MSLAEREGKKCLRILVLLCFCSELNLQLLHVSVAIDTLRFEISIKHRSEHSVPSNGTRDFLRRRLLWFLHPDGAKRLLNR